MIIISCLANIARWDLYERMIDLRAFEFQIRENDSPCKGLTYVTTSSLEDMYRDAKYRWEHLNDWSGENFWCDRVHTLEAAIQESRKGKYVFMKTSKY